MHSHPIIVQKYGGACLETPAKVRAVAAGLADLHGRGNSAADVLAAAGKLVDWSVGRRRDSRN